MFPLRVLHSYQLISQPQTTRPVVTLIPDYSYRRGPVTYTEKEFQDIFMFGVKVKGLKREEA